MGHGDSGPAGQGGLAPLAPVTESEVNAVDWLERDGRWARAGRRAAILGSISATGKGGGAPMLNPEPYGLDEIVGDLRAIAAR